MRSSLVVRTLVAVSFVGLLAGVSAPVALAQDAAADAVTVGTAEHKQLVLWTSGDREVALKMVFMYTYNCKKRGWMDTVRLLVWGPSSKLLSEDEELQEKLGQLKEVGVELYACKACADMYGVSDKLTSLGVTVEYTGKMLADLQQNGWHVLPI